ncbi:hypothetical protein GCM10011575_19040 [Microlunatus endophyticus]|uniref:Acyl-CoA thioester hydrolase n=1 Tax=Microlunatus endophyticus TaxID=1716077 RepID=A0A917S613_9ACTN|nr:acyl-CoA thioesterase [Microlunatus endophyticus]GGL60715.1 hypothetical protein GCM10011575_19040 [Microlunatus endophyticus]
MPFCYRVPKRYTDLNLGGHVDHGVVIDYLQEARTEFLLSSDGPMPAMLDSGVLVTGHQVEYLAPIGSDSPGVDAEVWVDQVGAARFSISYRLSDAGTPVVRARTFLTPYDLASAGLRRLTGPERDQLTAAVEPPVGIEPLGRVTAAELGHARGSDCRVRWADLDSYRHVNNVKFFDYFSQARLELLPSAESWVVVRQDLDYKRPIDFRRPPYQVRTAVVRIGSASIEFAADIIDPQSAETRPYATARTVMVRTGPDGRSEPITDDVRAALGA